MGVMATSIGRKQRHTGSGPGKEALIEVAQRLFTERGYDHVSLQQIAEEAGMTKGAMYYYFQNKEEVFARVSARIVAGLRDSVIAAMTTADSFEESLILCLVTAVESASGNLELWFADSARVLPAGAVRAAALEDFGIDGGAMILLPYFQAAAANGDITRLSPETAAHIFEKLLELMVRQEIDDRSPGAPASDDVEQQARVLVDVFLHGV
ncbi:MAG TPA: helix-turn-helix domain-containing protein [Thermomicrobiales bacterium]|nr:helix-turn-helix domain-containing protein [Thermomicrobiales bacterium]